MKNSLVDAAAAIQEAGWSECGLPHVIRTVAAQIGATGGVALDFSSEDRELLRAVSYGLPPVEAEFAEEMLDPSMIQPHIIYSLEHADAHTICDYDVMSEREISKSPFYDWLQRAVGVKYFVGSRLNSGGPVITLLGMHYEAKQGHASKQLVERCRQLRPHIANAFRIGRLREQAGSAPTFADVLTAHLPFGLICLNRIGRCIMMNAAAEDIIGQCDGLTVGNERRLRLTDKDADRALQTAVGRALRSSAGEALFAGDALLARRPSGLPSYLIRTEPGLRRSLGYDAGVPAVLVKIQDPCRRVSLSEEQLRALFGLTQRESELLYRLTSGEALQCAASAMGISYNTARVHLQHIYEKTGVTSQSELVSRFSTPFP
jgi:DNA-binding CsgD family transcriptional regulator